MLNLGGNVEVGAGGIWLNCKNNTYINGGSLTSESYYLNIHLNINADSIERLWINSPINNNSTSAIGLYVRAAGIWPVTGRWRAVGLGGATSNGFTGETIVGGRTVLALNKQAGATAIRGNVVLRKNTGLSFWGSNQVADYATVTMDSAHLNMHGAGYEKIHKLIVTGNSKILFGSAVQFLNRRIFLLDELTISYLSSLEIMGWADGRDHFLVRRYSSGLNENLSRIKFNGRKEPKAGLRYYDTDYWEIIPAFPEPSTYGAIFGGLGMGLAFWSRRRRAVLRTHVQTEE